MYFPHAFRKSFLPSTVSGTTLSTATTATSPVTVLPISTSVTGIAVGNIITGTGIPAGTTVVLISSLNITLSNAITAPIASGATVVVNGTNFTTSAAVNSPNVLSFSSTTGVSVGMSVTASGIPSGTTVIAVSGTSVTLSSSVTANVATSSSIAFGASVPVASTGSTASLTAGQIGFFTPDGLSIQSASSKPFIVAGGSYFKQDKIGPVHGGYKESWKSKMINPKYISRVIKVNANQPRQMVVNVPVTCGLACDTTYRLRVDIKGSPALRFLSHNMYRVLDAYTGCCDATNPSLLKDPIPTLLNWKDQINNSLIFNTMVQARVYSKVGANLAGTWGTATTGTYGVSSITAGTATITLGSANTTSVTVGQKVVGAGVPANSFITSVTSGTTVASITATTTTSTISVTASTVTGTTIAQGMAVFGTNVPAGAYVSSYTNANTYTITFPTQAVAPTAPTALTLASAATISYPPQQTAPTLPTGSMKVYNDLYSGAANTPQLGAVTYIPGTGTESGVGGSAAISAGTIADGSIAGTGSTGAILYDMNPAGASSFSVDAHLELTAAYVETKFGNCTFTPTDKYDLEPLLMYTSIVDETGDPCSVFCFTTTNSNTGVNSAGNDATVVQAPLQALGVGETVLRDLILSNRYLQNAYPDSSRVESLRMREIEVDPMLDAVTRTSLYDQVMVLHSVPRFNNPNGTFDNDQYLLVFYVPTGTSTTALTNYLVSAATAAGNSIPTNAAGINAGINCELY